MSCGHRARSAGRQPQVRLAVVAGSVVLMAACGADGVGAAPTEPTVAPSNLGGTYRIEQLVVDGADAAIDELGVDGAAEVVIDAQFGGLRIETSCGTLLGSFTLEDSGRAGVTIAGGSSRECSTTAADQQAELLTALDRIDAWDRGDAAEPPGQLELTSRSAAIVLSRR